MRGRDIITWILIITGVVYFYKTCIHSRQQTPVITDEYRKKLLEEDRKEALRRGNGSWRRQKRTQ